ncbi:MAG: DNA sulfur modification protein DndE, partial [Candidatus Omnitrophica bacterium]|nr:DNA sulfur modification protein DndE [Candidatus Omnitrophota bacterium]
MNPPVETIRLGKQSRDQLIKIKRITGIENWNIICRWALCTSLREPTLPPKRKISVEDGVEITWKVFAGDQAAVYAGLIRNCYLRQNSKSMSEAEFTHAHVQRGLGFLASGTTTKNISDFLKR